MALNKGKAETQIVGFPHHNLLQAPTAILGLGMELHAEVPSEGGGMEQEHKDPSHLEPLSQFLGKERDGGLDRIAKPPGDGVPNEECDRDAKHRFASFLTSRVPVELVLFVVATRTCTLSSGTLLLDFRRLATHKHLSR